MTSIKTSCFKNRNSATSALALAVGAAAVLGLTGCLDNYGARILSDPEKKHAIHFSSETETLYVELPHGGAGLSHNQAADVRRFAERYKAESTSGLKIAAPRTAGGRFSVARSMRQVEDIVSAAGIPSNAVHAQDYSGHNPEFGPALRIAYRRPVAQPPYCENWSADLGVDRERLPHRDFGCATQRNLALTVANARDLRHPQHSAPRSSERRSVTWTEYVGGGSSDSGSGQGGSSVSGGAGTPGSPTTSP
ncbi:MAG: CpaD family pilus assembly protein [Alphaproteobacteria bacterium]|nr:CpaD family pilus assembly protein [Alphaproteobacteria bacterium]